VRTLGVHKTVTAGVITSDPSQQWAVQLASGDVAYAKIVLVHPTPSGCTPVAIRSLVVVAPHVAGGRYAVAAPVGYMGCGGSTVVGDVGQVTAKRSK
jgi:hypothetical protein